MHVHEFRILSGSDACDGGTHSSQRSSLTTRHVVACIAVVAEPLGLGQPGWTGLRVGTSDMAAEAVGLGGVRTGHVVEMNGTLGRVARAK